MDYWEVHGMGFLIALMLFPRITMLVVGVCATWSCPWFWVGWVLAPRFTVAIIATTLYWDTNPVLCVIAFMMASSGDTTEKKVITYRGSNGQ